MFNGFNQCAYRRAADRSLGVDRNGQLGLVRVLGRAGLRGRASRARRLLVQRRVKAAMGGVQRILEEGSAACSRRLTSGRCARREA
jgi:hypothetical protein